jgi:hypothetical protein
MKIYRDSFQIQRPPFLGGDHWMLDQMKPVTVLLGRNGSGKSQLLRSWRDQGLEGSHYVVPERSGGLEFGYNYVEGQLTFAGRRNTSMGNVSPAYRQQVIARIQAYLIKRGAFKGTKLPGDIADLEEFLAGLLPDFTAQLISETPFFETTENREW